MTEIKTEKLANIKPDLTNANRHTERGNAMLRASMDEFGFAEAGTLDANNRIIGGNHRTEVAADVLGSDEVLVIEVDGTKPVYIKRSDIDLNTEQGRRLAYALNRTAQVSIEFDPERVLADIGEGISLDGLFHQNEIDELLAEIAPPMQGEDTEPEISRADELRQEWGTELGQLWALGKHRLICGDCTDEATVKRVMGGELADLVVTSPPYNRGTTTGGGFNDKGLSQQLTNSYDNYADDMPKDKYYDWQSRLLTQWWGLIAPNGAIYYNHRPRIQDGLYETPLEWNPGLPIRQIVIWNSGAGVNFAPTHYRPSSEWVVIFAKPGFRLATKGASGIGDVWSFGADRFSDHPATFPIGIPSTAIETTKSEIILDPFSGSGTTLIAAHNLSRRARAIEISPSYVAVALQRYYDHTGIKPELIDTLTL